MKRFDVTAHKENQIILHNQEQSIYTHIRVLEPSIINVRVSTEEEISFPTWTITPGDTELPFEGLSRQNMKPFSLPEYSFSESDESITITTEELKLDIQKEGFYLTWFQKMLMDPLNR